MKYIRQLLAHGKAENKFIDVIYVTDEKGVSTVELRIDNKKVFTQVI